MNCAIRNTTIRNKRREKVQATAAHAARCTARHGVGSHAEPSTME
jgi:hypothetical protein